MTDTKYINDVEARKYMNWYEKNHRYTNTWITEAEIEGDMVIVYVDQLVGLEREFSYRFENGRFVQEAFKSFFIVRRKYQFFHEPTGSLYSSSLDSLDGHQKTQTLPVRQLACRAVPHPRRGMFVTSSCGGMFLTEFHDRYIRTIWNPFTRQCCELAEPNPSNFLMGLGFGHDSTGDYKVVIVSRSMFFEPDITLVYSMRSGFWMRIDDCPRQGRSWAKQGLGEIIKGVIRFLKLQYNIYLSKIQKKYVFINKKWL